MRFVIGLGNPGREYVHTRHNVGWLTLDELARAWKIKGEHEIAGGLLAARGEIGLFKPLTFMNESGRAVAAFLHESGVGPEQMLVLLDELSLPLGALRMRGRGSAGGHKGLESVIEWLGTDQIPRLRLGIGPLRAEMTSREFVLSPFDQEELPLVERMVRRAALAAQCWAAQGLQAAMSRYNGPLEPSERDTGARKCPG